MDRYSLYEAVGETADDFLIDAEQVIRSQGKHNSVRRKRKGAMLAIAAVIAVLGATAAAAASMGCSIIDWIMGGFHNNVGAADSPDTAVLQEELDEGQWIYLNGDHIAVIIPESPVKIVLSSDAGETWRESTVVESETWDFLEEHLTDVQYYGGYIGFNGERNGYLVLTSGVAMNHQDLRIYLTDDGGKTWSEIGNPYDVHISALTGAGFASNQVGFISYRCFEDTQPDIWWTKDAGETWSKLTVKIPEKYAPDRHVFTPQSPTFDGDEGTYPIMISATEVDPEATIYMYSHDGGLTWSFEGKN